MNPALEEMKEVLASLPEDVQEKLAVETTLFEEAIDAIDLPPELAVIMIGMALETKFSGVINNGLEE